MSGIKLTLTGLLLAICGTGTVLADPYHHSHSNVHFGISIGVPVYGPGYGYGYGYSPYYYNPYRYYYPPAYAAPVYAAPMYTVAPTVSQPPEYVERPQMQADVQPHANSPYWYYCTATQAYYPYVKSCSSGWQQETPHAPQQ